LRHADPCAQACYLCLLTYYNQRDHVRIDKQLVIDFLQALSRESPVVGIPVGSAPVSPAGSLADTDWEVTLLRALEERGLRGAETQFEIREPGDGHVVTVPDMAFPRERIAIYADGDAHHTSPQDRAHDLKVRKRAQELGWRIRVFRNARITADLKGCVDDVQQLIEQL